MVIYKFFKIFEIQNEKYRKTPVYQKPVRTENEKNTEIFGGMPPKF